MPLSFSSAHRWPGGKHDDPLLTLFASPRTRRGPFVALGSCSTFGRPGGTAMMNMVQACGVVAKQRGEGSLLVATMGAMFIFDRIEGEMGDARHVPMVGGKAGLVIGLGMAKLKSVMAGSAAADKPAALKASRLSSVPLMGGAAGLGLGLALAQPQRKVVVVDGDASLLMELSGLVTVASARPANLIHVVIKNGTQFTGLANLNAPAQGFSFADAARNAGYHTAESIADGAVWAERFVQLLLAPGPHFVELIVEPIPQRTSDGFEQAEMPDLQFARMGDEALAVQGYLRSQGQ